MTALQRPWPLLLPALAVFAVYWPSLHFGYVWDDYFYLQEQETLHNWNSALRAAFSSGYLGLDYYFRPLGILSLALDQQLGGGSAVLSHLVNVLLHAANASLVALLALRLANRQPGPAAVAGLIYALHPALTETAAWISCRFDLLLALLALLFLLSLTGRATGWRRSLQLAATFFFAALAKESAIALALMLPLWLRWKSPAENSHWFSRQDWRDLAAVAAAGTVYLALRAWCLEGLHPNAQGHASADQALLLVLKTAGTYAALMFAPSSQIHPVHPLELPLAWNDWQVWLGTLALLAAGLTVTRVRTGNWKLLAASTLLALLPVLNILRLGVAESYAHDRLLTLPLVFPSLGAALLIAAAQGRTRLVGHAVLGIWLLASLATVISHLPVWSSNLALWQAVLQKTPRSGSAQNNYLTALTVAGRTEEALAYAGQLEKISNGDLSASQRVTYARLLVDAGRPSEALQQLEAGINAYGSRMRPQDMATFCVEAGWAQLASGHPQRARALLEGALKLNPGENEGRYYLGIGLLVLDEDAQGTAQMERALAEAPPSRRQSWLNSSADLLAGARQLAAQPLPDPPLDPAPLLALRCLVNAAP